MRFDRIPIPGGAEERVWQTLAAAFAGRVPNPQPRLLRTRVPVAVAAVVAALALAAAALSASGTGVVSGLRRALGVEHASPVLARLPAQGRVLVEADSGLWLVDADGSRRRLAGPGTRQGVWSPHGLFEAAVVGGDELAAIDPQGRVRWRLDRPAVGDPRWSGDGYRIAYRSGGSLRVVAGDGSGDRLIAARVAPVAPAWIGATHDLAFVARDDRVHLVDADTGRTIWISAGLPRPLQLVATAARVLVLERAGIGVIAAGSGAVSSTIPLAPGAHTVAASASGTIAVTTPAGAAQTSIVLVQAGRRSTRLLFRGAGTFSSLAWAPDGRWLLASWTTADQWVFVEVDPATGAPRRVEAISAIAHNFGARPSVQVGGWCCSAR